MLDSQLNWLRKSSGQPLTEVVEAKLYTDVHIIGEHFSSSPYAYINTIASGPLNRTWGAVPAIALRVSVHLPTELPQRQLATADDHYHGGDLIDEVTALASLLLGIRLAAGPVDRRFESQGDPYGRPIGYTTKLVPQLTHPTFAPPQIPRLNGARNLSALSQMSKFPEVPELDAIAAVKAARLYQQAMWIADTTPELAWLLLVSAVETAANRWASSRGSDEENLRMYMPQMPALLDRNGCSNVVPLVAKQLAGFIGATKKFTDFVVHFAPPPPEYRPAKHFQFDFDPQNLARAAKSIYRHRSKALHGGTTFPLPMCQAPRVLDPEPTPHGPFQEVPFGLAAHTRTATWAAKDTPMLLHTFEYIARRSLLRWWESL